MAIAPRTIAATSATKGSRRAVLIATCFHPTSPARTTLESLQQIRNVRLERSARLHIVGACWRHIVPLLQFRRVTARVRRECGTDRDDEDRCGNIVCTYCLGSKATDIEPFHRKLVLDESRHSVEVWRGPT